MSFRAFLFDLVNDRLIQFGTGTSIVSHIGVKGLIAHPLAVSPALTAAQPWISLFAALGGGLSAFAVFVLTAIKIARLLKNPGAKE